MITYSFSLFNNNLHSHICASGIKYSIDYISSYIDNKEQNIIEYHSRTIIDIFEEHDLSQFKLKNVNPFPTTNYGLILKVLYEDSCFRKLDIDTFNNILHRIPTKYRKRVAKALICSDEESLDQYYALRSKECIVATLKWIDECGINKEEDELYL